MADDGDLVARLREYRMDVDSPDVVYEAAGEIERLRAVVAEMAADELSRLGQELGT